MSMNIFNDLRPMVLGLVTLGLLFATASVRADDDGDSDDAYPAYRHHEGYYHRHRHHAHHRRHVVTWYEYGDYGYGRYAPWGYGSARHCPRGRAYGYEGRYDAYHRDRELFGFLYDYGW